VASKDLTGENTVSVGDDVAGEDVLTLVHRAKSGDLAAFDSLMIRYRERLYSVIYNMTFNHEDAADLTQETFVKAFRSLSKFKEKSSIFHLDLPYWSKSYPNFSEAEENPQVF